MERVCLGKAVKLHGFRGGLKMNAKYDDDFDTKKVKSMFDEEGNEYKISRLSKNTDGFYVDFENVDLEKANKLVNKMFYIDREVVSGKILIEDLKGSDVFFEDETLIGNIQDVQDYGAAEVFFVKTQKGTEIMFPNVKGVITSFDYTQKKLVVNKEKFREVCDYEN
jgi:16S rRNA processing protein RimM